MQIGALAYSKRWSDQPDEVLGAVPLFFGRVGKVTVEVRKFAGYDIWYVTAGTLFSSETLETDSVGVWQTLQNICEGKSTAGRVVS